MEGRCSAVSPEYCFRFNWPCDVAKKSNRLCVCVMRFCQDAANLIILSPEHDSSNLLCIETLSDKEWCHILFVVNVFGNPGYVLSHASCSLNGLCANKKSKIHPDKGGYKNNEFLKIQTNSELYHCHIYTNTKYEHNIIPGSIMYLIVCIRGEHVCNKCLWLCNVLYNCMLVAYILNSNFCKSHY
jgi:hypothetical protein